MHLEGEELNRYENFFFFWRLFSIFNPMKVARVTLIAARRKHQPQALSDSPTTPSTLEVSLFR